MGTNVQGILFFLITNSRRGVGGGKSGCDFAYSVLSFFSCFVFFFFTYSEALPALRLRRDDFGPPVGSALNNP